MLLKNYNLIFIFSLVSSTFLAVSSNSWFLTWLSLEINLMSMIPLMLINFKKNNTEAAIKYFLTQALASILLIFSVTINFFFTEMNILLIPEIFIILSLAMKSGLAPLHFWFLQVSNFLSWPLCLIIFTWQKIAPILLMFSLNSKMIFLTASISSLVGAAGGFNQNLMKILMSYSSIGHSGWMLLGCSLSISSWLLYFSIYTFLSISIIDFLSKNQIFKTNQIFSCSDCLSNKNIFIMNFLSLGGLPPLLGFLAKLSILLISFKLDIFLIFIPLILSSVVSLFFYTRLIYSNVMNFSNKTFSFLNINNTPSKILTFSVSILANLIIPVWLTLN